MKSIEREMNGAQLLNCYGMTEMSPVTFQTAFTDSFEKKTTTVGRVHPFVEAKVIGEDGSILKRGERGELCFRGYNLMLGYWDDEKKTAEVVDAQGWMHSGDLGVLDEEGYM